MISWDRVLKSWDDSHLSTAAIAHHRPPRSHSVTTDGDASPAAMRVRDALKMLSPRPDTGGFHGKIWVSFMEIPEILQKPRGIFI